MAALLIFLLATAVSSQPIDLDQVHKGVVVEITQEGQTLQRRVVGLPTDKRLAQDADFALRAQSTGATFTSVQEAENTKCFLRGGSVRSNRPDGIITRKADLVVADVVLDIPYTEYLAAPDLGDSLYFLHADPRTQLVDGVQMIQEDSREWGPVHAREFVRIVE